jgi:hypothetical protein
MVAALVVHTSFFGTVVWHSYAVIHYQKSLLFSFTLHYFQNVFEGTFVTFFSTWKISPSSSLPQNMLASLDCMVVNIQGEPGKREI